MKYLAISLLFFFFFPACNLYKNYSRPDNLPVDSLFNDSTLQSADTLSSLGSMPWQDLFVDPCLRNLIEEGLESNTDLLTAMLRIDEA